MPGYGDGYGWIEKPTLASSDRLFCRAGGSKGPRHRGRDITSPFTGSGRRTGHAQSLRQAVLPRGGAREQGTPCQVSARRGAARRGASRAPPRRYGGCIGAGGSGTEPKAAKAAAAAARTDAATFMWVGGRALIFDYAAPHYSARACRADSAPH